MTRDFDPSDDLGRIADGLEAVTLARRGSTPGGAPAPIAHALRRSVSMREAAASDGRYTAADVTWHLPVAELAQSPRLGDLIRSGDGRQWTVLEVRLTTLGTRWRCTTRSLAVVYGLDDTITILKAAYVQGAGGAAEATWLPWKTGVRARIQPLRSSPGGQHESRQVIARCQIFVEEELALSPAHRIAGPDGTIYKVLGVTAAERLGELQTIEAEVTPWP
jgi:hypothetical protein